VQPLRPVDTRKRARRSRLLRNAAACRAAVTLDLCIRKTRHTVAGSTLLKSDYVCWLLLVRLRSHRPQVVRQSSFLFGLPCSRTGRFVCFVDPRSHSSLALCVYYVVRTLARIARSHVLASLGPSHSSRVYSPRSLREFIPLARCARELFPVSLCSTLEDG